MRPPLTQKRVRSRLGAVAVAPEHRRRVVHIDARKAVRDRRRRARRVDHVAADAIRLREGGVCGLQIRGNPRFTARVVVVFVDKAACKAAPECCQGLFIVPCGFAGTVIVLVTGFYMWPVSVRHIRDRIHRPPIAGPVIDRRRQICRDRYRSIVRCFRYRP